MFEKRPTIINVNAPTRTEYVTREVREYRAPTDESVKLLKEMEVAAETKVLEAVRLEGNGFECVVHQALSAVSDSRKFKAVFSLNGKRMTAEVEINGSRGDRAEGWQKLRDEMAKVIAAEVLLSAIRNQG